MSQVFNIIGHIWVWECLYLAAPPAYIEGMSENTSHRPVLRAGHPILAKTAAAVTNPADPANAKLVQDMQASMEATGGTGIAAPQIGESLRLVIYRVGAERVTSDPEDFPIDLTVLINPEIELLSDETVLDWEGCLSLPGMRGEVPRPNRIRYSAYDLDGNRFEHTVSGRHARVVQHEVDHLDGILYPQRMVDMRRFGYTEEMLEAVLKMEGPNENRPKI